MRKAGAGMDGRKVEVGSGTVEEAVRYLREYYMSNVWRGEDRVFGGLSRLKSVADSLASCLGAGKKDTSS